MLRSEYCEKSRNFVGSSILQREGRPRQQVGEEVECVLGEAAVLHGGVEGEHGLVTQRDGAAVERVLGGHQPPPLGRGHELVQRQRLLEVAGQSAGNIQTLNTDDYNLNCICLLEYLSVGSHHLFTPSITGIETAQSPAK